MQKTRVFRIIDQKKKPTKNMYSEHPYLKKRLFQSLVSYVFCISFKKKKFNVFVIVHINTNVKPTSNYNKLVSTGKLDMETWKHCHNFVSYELPFTFSHTYITEEQCVY